MADHDYRPTPADYKLVFEDHKVGAAILEDLIRLYTKDAVTDGGIDAVLKTYMRMGQRAPLDHIVKQINRANNVPVEEEPEGPNA